MENVKESVIANKNDVFRKLGFGVTMTKAAATLPDIYGLMQQIRAFNEFTDKNDPDGEHDFGCLIWNQEKVIWKIDYYNDKLTCYEDPLSPTCKRVMTVMLAEEY
jgi:hypothetical protein